MEASEQGRAAPGGSRERPLADNTPGLRPSETVEQAPSLVGTASGDQRNDLLPTRRRLRVRLSAELAAEDLTGLLAAAEGFVHHRIKLELWTRACSSCGAESWVEVE